MVSHEAGGVTRCLSRLAVEMRGEAAWVSGRGGRLECTDPITLTLDAFGVSRRSASRLHPAPRE
jgi:hypothetical protein